MDGHQLFALIIGANQYTADQIPNLQGAVSDAYRIRDCIRSMFVVKDSNVTMLLDSDAKRDNIIRHLQDLAADPRIQKDDPILIYYAGHGMVMVCPKEWEGGTNDDIRVQAIMPHDFGQETENGKKVQAIPDRTVSALLKQIADKKGNNITVVFDSCHSGSTTRAHKVDPSRMIRGVDLIDPDLDRDLWGDPFESSGSKTISGSTRPAGGYFYAGSHTHVLLAACGASEAAREEFGAGKFTEALLHVLGRVGSEQLSYTELIARIPDLNGQHPECEGEHRKRALFDGLAPIRAAILTKIRK